MLKIIKKKLKNELNIYVEPSPALLDAFSNKDFGTLDDLCKIHDLYYCYNKEILVCYKYYKKILPNSVIDYGLIYSEKVHQDPSLTKNAIYLCDVDMYGSVQGLKENVWILGNFQAASSGVSEIPKNFNVLWDIGLRGTRIEKFPEYFKRTGSLDLSKSNIQKFPDNMTIDGSLDLSNTQNFTKFPKGMVINGDLNLNRTQFYYDFRNSSSKERDKMVSDLRNKVIVKGNIIIN